MARDYALLWANGMKFPQIMDLMREDIEGATEEEDPAEERGQQQGPGQEEQAADAGESEGSAS